MPVTSTTTIDAAREHLRGAPSPVVVIAVHNSYGDVVRCLESVVTHTPISTAVLVIDDGGVDRRALDLIDRLGPDLPHPIVVLHQSENRGYVRAANDAFAATAGRDVVLLNSDVVVGPEWLERLTAAARSADSVATASTLTNHGTILSVPRRNQPTPRLADGVTPEEAARRVAAGSLRLRPDLPTAVGHCTYIRRAALDLVGGFDEAFSPGYGEEVDFSQRAVAHGFRHVCADDVFTFHRGSGSFTPGVAASRQEAHEALVRQRYPWYHEWVRWAAEDTDSRLALALTTARRSLIGLRIGIDARCLGEHRMGTQQVVIETVQALARRPEVALLVAFAPRDLPPYAQHLRSLREVVLVDADRPWEGAHHELDLIYRPFQLTRADQLNLLDRLADRFVINQLDTIAFENPAYFEDTERWRSYRDLTRLAFERAGGVAFLSGHSHRSAEAVGLLRAGTPARVVPCGVDGVGPEIESRRPSGLVEGDRGFLLVLGAAYLHKNRRRALDLWAELRRRGSDRRIVLAGPAPPDGSSLAAEAELLLEHPQLRPDVVTIGAVSEGEKRWLYQRCGLVLYLSTSEGFGLVPFEAAAHGVPTLCTRQGSLDEVLPPGIPVLDSFDVLAGADVAEKLLGDESAGARLCAEIAAAGEAFTWDRTAGELMALFEEALRQPRRRVLAVEGESGDHVGLPSRVQRDRPALGAAGDLERLVRAVTARQGLKRRLSPDGSRRQRAARYLIGQARSYLD